MADNFAGVDSLVAPAVRAVAVVPHDANALADVPKALFVGTGGDLMLGGVGGGSDVLFRNMPGGTVLPFRARHVRATGTSASDIVALY